MAQHLMAHHETAVSRPRQQVARRHVLIDKKTGRSQPEQCSQCAALSPADVDRQRRAEAEAARHLKGPPQNP